MPESVLINVSLIFATLISHFISRVCVFQALCNSMMAVAEMGFDATTNPSNLQENQLHKVMNCLWGLFQKRLDTTIDNIEHLTQAAPLLELMHIQQPDSIQIIDDLNFLSLSNINLVDQQSSKSNDIHHQLTKELSAELSLRSDKYRVENEFHGLKGGSMPVDIAVFYEKKLILCVELDGPHHYTWEGNLTRKDLLKDFLYVKTYPDIPPLLRFRNEVVINRGISSITKSIVDAVTSSESCKSV